MLGSDQSSDPTGYANPDVTNMFPWRPPNDNKRKDLMYYNIQSSCSSQDDSRDN